MLHDNLGTLLEEHIGVAQTVLDLVLHLVLLSTWPSVSFPLAVERIHRHWVMDSLIPLGLQVLLQLETGENWRAGLLKECDNHEDQCV